MTQIAVDTVLHLEYFGLERLDEDRAIVGFAQKAEAHIVRWLDFAKGALLFLMVPGDNESGTFYIYDRDRSAFYPLSLPVEQRFGGFREEEFESLTKAFDLVALAKNPRVLRVWHSSRSMKTSSGRCFRVEPGFSSNYSHLAVRTKM